MERPFFDVQVELDVPNVAMSPSLDEIQQAINRCSRAVLACSKNLPLWKSDPTVTVAGSSLYDLVTRDREVVRVVLLLAGAVEGAKRQVLLGVYLRTSPLPPLTSPDPNPDPNRVQE